MTKEEKQELRQLILMVHTEGVRAGAQLDGLKNVDINVKSGYGTKTPEMKHLLKQIFDLVKDANDQA